MTTETGLTLLVFWFFSNVVSTMPKPDDIRALGLGPGPVLLYTWLFELLHISAGNAARVIPSLRIGNGHNNGKD